MGLKIYQKSSCDRSSGPIPTGKTDSVPRTCKLELFGGHFSAVTGGWDKKEKGGKEKRDQIRGMEARGRKGMTPKVRAGSSFSGHYWIVVMCLMSTDFIFDRVKWDP